MTKPVIRRRHVTLKMINHRIRCLGGAEVLKKYRAGPSYYFAGGDAKEWPYRHVMHARLNDLTLDEWVEAWQRLRAIYLKFR